MATRFSRFSPIAVAALAATASPICAQDTGIELGFGLWWSDSLSTIYSLSLERPLLGPIDYGLGLTHLKGPEGRDDDRLTGVELSTGILRNGSGPYLVAAAGLGMRHSSGNFDAQWSAGAGYEFRLLNALSIGLDGRYRVEDRGSRGFWRLHPDDARGIVVNAHMTVRFGGTGRSSALASPRDTYRERPPPAAEYRVPDADAPRDVVELRAAVVETAVDVMGTPYMWGGEGDGGFDCSGLIQYAYGRHGLILPRTSRDQARMGQRVDPLLASLQPGDILGFSDGGGGITHVGLYVGDGMFIHSSSSGVKLSSLTNPEGDGRWWQQRWVVARRLIN